MSDTIHAYEFTGHVTSIDFYDGKIYVTVTKRRIEASSEPNRLVEIITGVEFWTTEPRDFHYAETVFKEGEEGTFTIPRDQLVNYWESRK